MNKLNTSPLHNAKLAKDRQGSRQGWITWENERFLQFFGKLGQKIMEKIT